MAVRRQREYAYAISRKDSHMHQPTVLLVEDNPDDVLLLAMALRGSAVGVRLQHVTDGRVAIAYLKGEGRYDNRQSHPLPGLVILDLHLPNSRGLSVLRWIRKQQWLRGLPVVIYSGTAHGAAIEDAMQNGADTYIIKGRDTRELVQLLQNANLAWTMDRRNLPAASRGDSFATRPHNS